MHNNFLHKGNLVGGMEEQNEENEGNEGDEETFQGHEVESYKGQKEVDYIDSLFVVVDNCIEKQHFYYNFYYHMSH